MNLTPEEWKRKFEGYGLYTRLHRSTPQKISFGFPEENCLTTCGCNPKEVRSYLYIGLGRLGKGPFVDYCIDCLNEREEGELERFISYLVLLKE